MVRGQMEDIVKRFLVKWEPTFSTKIQFVSCFIDYVGIVFEVRGTTFKVYPYLLI